MSVKAAKNTSIATVTFVDGEIKNYNMSAGIGVGNWIAEQVKRTGILTLYNDSECYNIPISQVREYTIKACEVTYVSNS